MAGSEATAGLAARMVKTPPRRLQEPQMGLGLASAAKPGLELEPAAVGGAGPGLGRAGPGPVVAGGAETGLGLGPVVAGWPADQPEVGPGPQPLLPAPLPVFQTAAQQACRHPTLQMQRPWRPKQAKHRHARLGPGT